MMELILFFALLVFTSLPKGIAAAQSCWIAHLICLSLLISLITKRNKDKARIGRQRLRTPLDLPILLFGALLILSMAFSIDRTKSILELLKVIDCIIIYYLMAYSCDNRKNITLYIYLVIGVGFSLSMWGIIQYLGGANHSWWLSAKELAGPFDNSNLFAGYLGIVIMMGLGLMFTRLEIGKKALLGYALIIMTITFAFTLSRGGWASVLFSLAVMAILFLLKAKKYRGADDVLSGVCRPLATVAVLGVVVTGLVITLVGFEPISDKACSLFDAQNKKEIHSLNGRLPLWRTTLHIIRDYPVVGTGLGTFPIIHTQYIKKMPANDAYAWNEYLQVIMETGSLSLGVVLWLIVSLLLRCVRIYMREDSKFEQGIILGIFGGILATALHSFISPLLHVMSNGILLVMLAGMAMSRYFQMERGFRDEIITRKTIR